MRRDVISGIRPRFQGLSQSQGQVAHVLLTRSPLINPASWASPFDLHVLSTPPAFVLSQNQTLRQCSHATNPPKQASNKHNEQTRRSNQIRLQKGPGNPRGGHRIPISTINPPRKTRRVIWHRLLGTLLSSQGTDAHLPEILRSRARGLCVLPVRRGDPGALLLYLILAASGTTLASWSVAWSLRQPTGPGRTKHRSISRGWPPAGPTTCSDPCGSGLGVRSSLPGDLWNITRRVPRSANRCRVTPVTTSAHPV
jgi:hypothetical protein